MRRSTRRLVSTGIGSAARYLAECRTAPKQLCIHDGAVEWPNTVAAAYAEQALLHEMLWNAGHTVIGNKVGCTTPVMQKYLDVPHPCAGGIYDTGLWRQSSAEPVEVDVSRFRRLGLECEIAVVLGAAMEPGVADLTAAARAVDTVHAAVEMVDDRYESFETRRPGVCAWIADDFFHAGSILGPPLAADPLGLDALSGAMWVDGACVGEGRGCDIVAGHPLEALVWLANSEMAAAMGGLPRGWVVSLGSVCKTVWLDHQPTAARTEVRVAFGAENEMHDGGEQALGERSLQLAAPESILSLVLTDGG